MMNAREYSRVLIVDDDAAIRDAYREILVPAETGSYAEGARLFGEMAAVKKNVPLFFQVEEAENGEEAVQIFQDAMERKTPFHVAFVDMKMPGMSGAETARELYRMDPRIKVAIVTAFSDMSPDQIVQVTAREDMFYLRKPFDPNEIRQFAKALCRQWALEEERDRLEVDLRDANAALEDVNRTLDEKVKQRTRVLQARNDILQMMIQDTDIRGVAERICREISEEFGIDALFVDIPFMGQVFSNQSDSNLSVDLKRLSDVSQRTCARVREEYGCALPLMREKDVLGVCLSNHPDLPWDELKGWLSLLTVGLMQARSLRDAPELVQAIDRLIGEF